MLSPHRRSAAPFWLTTCLALLAGIVSAGRTVAPTVPGDGPAGERRTRPGPSTVVGAQESTGTDDGSGEGLPWSSPARVTGDALARYRQRAGDSDRPHEWFNLGAALLLTGDWEGAIPPLERALAGDSRELEESATYDLGLSYAVAGKPPVAGGDEALAGARGGDRRAWLLRARDAFRWVLRSNPLDEDARWNLEVVERWLRQDSQAGGGGGGGGGGSGGGGASESASADGPAPDLTPEQAQALLDAAAREERDVQNRRLERNRARDPVVEKNW